MVLDISSGNIRNDSETLLTLVLSIKLTNLINLLPIGTALAMGPESNRI